MQSVSLNPSPLAATAWQRTRAAVPASTVWTAAIVLLLVFVIAKSTVAASWVVIGIDTAPTIALAAAVLAGVLALTPLPWWLCVGVAMALGPVVAAVDSAPAFHTFHANDPAGLALVQAWIQRVQDGSAFAANDFVLFVIVWLMWITGAWLAWCVLRWRQPLIGLIPGAAAFATNVLNWPKDQNGFTLAFLVLTFALLLWTNYTGSIAKATRARMKLTGDARWDFWESGLVATAALIVAGILLPPLSTVDRTATMESSIFTSWAQLQQELNHAASDSISGAGSGPGTTGFSTDVKLGNQLKKSNTPVFTYTVFGTYIGPKYFRGVSVTDPVHGEWTYDSGVQVTAQIPRGVTPNYSETYDNATFATFSVNMSAPPGGNQDILFYPGQFVKADRRTIVRELINPFPVSADPPLVTIDRLSAVPPATSKGGYNITSQYPNAFATELEDAGTVYPDWLQYYVGLPESGYRSPNVIAIERNLALQITAGLTNPYDMATKIQEYFRSSGVFHYNLDPGSPPDSTEDRMQWFLQTGHTGYCEYFAMAMADMLRLLNIPTRLVNGFGPGTYESSLNRWQVYASDAHTWVEVYFPKYGWIPFEPTPDFSYNNIQRGQSTGSLCVNDTICGGIGATGPGGAIPTPSRGEIGRQGGNQTGATNAGGGTGGFKLGVPDAGTLTRILAVLLAVMLLIAAYVSRYLRPRTVMGVWQRTLVLARLAGAAVSPGETPYEVGRRLARVFPEVDSPMRALAGGFAVAAYAPPDLAAEARGGVLDAWAQLRPLMLKRVFARARPHRP
jgi:transglutaminase-like putative cysteine protease